MAFTEGKTNKECLYLVWAWRYGDDCKGTVLLQSKSQNASSGWGAMFFCDLAHAASGTKKTKASAHGSVDGGKDYSSIIC